MLSDPLTYGTRLLKLIRSVKGAILGLAIACISPVQAGTSINIKAAAEAITNPNYNALGEVSKIVSLIRNTDAPKIKQYWWTSPTFCAFGSNPNNPYYNKLQTFIDTINVAFDRRFKFVKVNDYKDCPKNTYFYALFDGDITAERLAPMLEDITGSKPPRSFLDSLINDFGFSFPLSRYGKRKFLYVKTDLPEIESNEDPSFSIMIEMMFHALASLGNFDTKQMISIAGRDFSGPEWYDHWFHLNARGLCLADVYILEMALGNSLNRKTEPRPVTDWFDNDQVDDLDTRVFNAQLALTDYMDLRCHQPINKDIYLGANDDEVKKLLKWERCDASHKREEDEHLCDFYSVFAPGFKSMQFFIDENKRIYKVTVVNT